MQKRLIAWAAGRHLWGLTANVYTVRDFESKPAPVRVEKRYCNA